MDSSIREIIDNLRTFIELSHLKDEKPWEVWVESTVKRIETKCWERKQCNNKLCPAYLNNCGRCWLLAGTMCAECVEGEFAKKYENCSRCEIFQGAVYQDGTTELKEFLIILIYSLRTKHHALKSAHENLRILSGLLPICASCKKIRDDQGYWQQIEEYVTERSEAVFSHGICPECMKRYYPEITLPEEGGSDSEKDDSHT